ncbi:hypothetical protein Tco_0635229 [Tanacetum coccineum]
MDDTTLTHALLLVIIVERQDIRLKTSALHLVSQTKEDQEAKEDREVMSLVLDVAKKDITRTSVRTIGIKVVEIKFEATRKTLRTIRGRIKGTLREVTKHQPVLKEDVEHLQRNVFPGALLHDPIAQVRRERPLTESFEKKSCKFGLQCTSSMSYIYFT